MWEFAACVLPTLPVSTFEYLLNAISMSHVSYVPRTGPLTPTLSVGVPNRPNCLLGVETPTDTQQTHNPTDGWVHPTDTRLTRPVRPDRQCPLGLAGSLGPLGLLGSGGLARQDPADIVCWVCRAPQVCWVCWAHTARPGRHCLLGLSGSAGLLGYVGVCWASPT